MRPWHPAAAAAAAAQALPGVARRFSSTSGRAAAAGGEEKAGEGGARLTWDDETLRLRFADGRERAVAQTLWLRDACSCARCVDPDSGQKYFSTTDVPLRPRVEHAEFGADGSLRVVFADDALSGGGRHESVFPAAEVRSWQAMPGVPRGGNVSVPARLPWNRAMYESQLARGACRVAYQDWMNSEEAFWSAFADLCRTGLIFVTGVPGDEREVVKIAERIGPLQYTFYGWTWDVKSKPQAENVAYTNQYLGLHQDLLYHVPTPKLQLLHCLANSCEGGESLFSSGVRAAYELQLTQPEHYETLKKTPAHFHYGKGGHHYYKAIPTISEARPGYPADTNWAPPFQTAFPNLVESPQVLTEWRRAAKAFQDILESPDNMIEVKLKPGECVIFDNRAVLHGRREFVTSQGNRWLKGAYISPQVFAAKETVLSHRLMDEGEPLLCLEQKMAKELELVERSLQAEDAAAERQAATA